MEKTQSDLKLEESLQNKILLSTEKSIQEGSEGVSSIEKQITVLCSEIKSHRVEQGGECWHFCIAGLEFDYGEIWSSPDYWKSLAKANAVNKDFCLFNFSFKKGKNICDSCSISIEMLNKLYEEYLNNLKEGWKNENL